MKKFQLGVIGGGFMATAIIEGAIKKGFLSENAVAVSDPSADRCAYFAQKGVYATENNVEIAQNSEFLLFAVKPQVFSIVAEQLKGKTNGKIITIMAGVPKASIQTALNAEKVARAMPNLPCSVGAGMIGLDATDFNERDGQFVQNLFSATGKVELVDECLLNAVTGVSGSGPAYVYLFIKSLQEAGVKEGFSPDQALNFAIQTVKGGVTLVEEHPEKSLDELICAVSSKGGTTVVALGSFAKDGFQEIVSRAVSCAVKRAEELSK